MGKKKKDLQRDRFFELLLYSGFGKIQVPNYFRHNEKSILA